MLILKICSYGTEEEAKTADKEKRQEQNAGTKNRAADQRKRRSKAGGRTCAIHPQRHVINPPFLSTLAAKHPIYEIPADRYRRFTVIYRMQTRCKTRNTIRHMEIHQTGEFKH